MDKTQFDEDTMTTTPIRTASKLDRAIALSVSAMLAMTAFVMVAQMQPGPQIAGVQAFTPAQQA